MLRRDFLLSTLAASVAAAACPLGFGPQTGGAIRKILIAGGGYGTPFIRSWPN